MLNTNLLPKEETKNMRLERWSRGITFLAGGLSVVMLLGAALLLPSFLPLFFEKKELERFLILEDENAKKRGIKDEVERVQEAKNKLLTIWNFVDSPPKASPVLDVFFEVDNSLPGITLISFNVSDAGKIFVNGLAKSREDLLEFESRLKQSGKFTSVYTPLPTIVRGAENFSTQLQLKPNFSL